VSQSPTPWRLDEDGDIIAANQVLVAIVPCKDDKAILAAAPDLLRLLKEVFEDGLQPNMQSWRDATIAAIKKAEGSS